MKKTNTIIYVLIAVGVIALLAFGINKFHPVSDEGNIVTPVTTSNTDVKNISYVIDGETFLLKNGVATKEIAPGSASVQTVRLFGDPIYGDLNGDGNAKDAAVMLVSNSGGSGAFYYAALAIASGTEYVATNALLLGDRIAPQTVEIQNGRAVYNYAERKAGEPMTTQPSVGKSLWVNYDIKTGEIGGAGK